MCSNYGATEVKSLTIYMGGPTYTRHHEQSLTKCKEDAAIFKALIAVGIGLTFATPAAIGAWPILEGATAPAVVTALKESFVSTPTYTQGIGLPAGSFINVSFLLHPLYLNSLWHRLFLGVPRE